MKIEIKNMTLHYLPLHWSISSLCNLSWWNFLKLNFFFSQALGRFINLRRRIGQRRIRRRWLRRRWIFLPLWLSFLSTYSDWVFVDFLFSKKSLSMGQKKYFTRVNNSIPEIPLRHRYSIINNSRIESNPF